MDNFKFDLDTNMDEDFFGSLHTNRNRKILNHLFNEEFEDNDEGSQQQQKSLKYQYCKSNVETSLNQKQQQQQRNTTEITWATVVAKVVTAYNQQPEQQQRKLYNGKFGLALLSSSPNTNKLDRDNNDRIICKLILYKSKSQILESLLLNADEKQLYKQSDGYLQFLNSKREYWITLRFANEYDESEFHEKLLSYNFKVYEEYNCNNIKKSNADDAKSNLQIHERNIKETEHIVSMCKPLTKQMLLEAKMSKPLSASSSSKDITTDSCDTEIIQMPAATLSKPLIQPRSHKYSSSYQNYKQIIANGKLEPTTTSLPSTCTTSENTAPLIMSISNIEAQYIPMLLTEQRTQNTELRWNVNKLEEKIEKVLDKLEKVEINTRGHQPFNVDHHRRSQGDIIIELERKIIQLKKENRHLNFIIKNFNKQHLQEDEDKKEAKDEKIIKSLLHDFEQDNHRFLQEQNVHVNANMDLKEFLDKLISSYQELNRKVKLKQGIIEQESQQRIIESNQFIEEELRMEVMTLKDNKLHLENQQQKLAMQVEESKRIERELNNTVDSLREENLQLNDQLKKQLTEQLTHEKSNEELQLAVKLKAIMNDIYSDLSDNLQAQYPESQESHHLLSLLATAFKTHTLKALPNSSFSSSS